MFRGRFCPSAFVVCCLLVSALVAIGTCRGCRRILDSVSFVVVGFNVNTNRLDDKKLLIPASWADLTDAQYNDEVLASNPNTSGTAYTTVSGLLQIMGEEKGW